MVTLGHRAYQSNSKQLDLELLTNGCDSHIHVLGLAVDFGFSAISTYLPVDAGKDTLYQSYQFLSLFCMPLPFAQCWS